MLVTQNELRAHELQMNTKTFSAHFGRMAVEWKLGKRGLQNVYDTNDLKNYAYVYMKRIVKHAHLARHKSVERFEEFLKCIEALEAEVNVKI